MVGREAEEQGIVKHGSKMIQAVANATVPQLTVILGASFGAGNYGMCGRSYDPRFIFAWPNSQIAVMGGEQAAKVMEIITAAKFARKGMQLDEAGLQEMSRGIREKLDRESTALYATARLWDDGIIDPRDTREVLSFALAVCREAEQRELRRTSFGVGRM
jgi:geranyl-CoA carboxylase beta subunit